MATENKLIHMKTKNYKFKNVLFLLIFFTGFQHIQAQKTDIDIDPNQRYQVFDGWGANLSWWANFVGGWSEKNVDNLMYDLTSPDELNMNVWKYNLHAGDNPESHADPETERILQDGSLTHLRWESMPITGYKKSPTARYDWAANTNQRRILRKLLQIKPNSLVDAISYSPPWWMTISGCSAGGVVVNGRGTPNLADENIEPYAEYLTDIVQYYHDNLGITLHSISAFNEAFNTNWKFGGKTEGNVATVPTLKKTYEALYRNLQERKMDYCVVNALDESSINAALNVFNQFEFDDSFMPKLGLINTHSYAGIARSGMSDIAQTYNLKIWQSEFGGNVGSGTRTYVWHAEKIIEDVEDMHVNAWLIWQVVSGGPWGMYDYDFNDDRPATGIKSTKIFKNKVYYAMKQFSKYIKPGYQIIRSENEKTLAALSPDKKELVVVMVNRNKSTLNRVFNLSKFTSTGTTARAIRTSLSENAVSLNEIAIEDGTINYDAPPESITTFVIDVKTPKPYKPLPDGLYNIQVKHSGKYMSVDEAPTGIYTFISQNDLEDNNRFKFVVQRKGYDYEIRPVNNEKYLTILGRSESNGAGLIEFDARGFDNQRFHIVPDGETGYYKIINKNSNLYLAVRGANNQSNGGDIVQFQDFGSGNFRWKFEPVEDVPAIEDGDYYIKAVHSDKYMAVKDRASSNGATIEQTEYFKNDSLAFEVTRQIDGFYKIRPAYSSKVLTTVDNPNNSNGKPAFIFSDIDAGNQKFMLTELATKGQFTISPKNNPTRTLAVAGQGQDNGDQVVLWEYLGSDNFKWVFEAKPKKAKLAKGLKNDDFVMIYPNPTGGSLTIIKKAVTYPLNLQVYSRYGEEMMTSLLTEETSQIYLDENLRRGIYLFRFSNNEKIFWQRVILK